MKEVNIIKTRKFLLLTLLILLLFPIDSKAVHSNLSYAERIDVVPLWDNVKRLNVNISNSSNIVNCLLNIRSKENQNIIGTMYLEKFENGRWISIRNWRISGIGNVSRRESSYVSKGYSYRVRVQGNVNGEYFSTYSNQVVVR